MDSSLGPKGRFGTALVLTVALGSTSATPLARSQDQEPADAPVRAPQARPITVSTGAVSGTIVDIDGKTPCAGALVILRNGRGEVVARAQADGEGRFRLGDRAEGTYRLEVGRARGELAVNPGATVKTLVLVLPRAIAFPIHAAADEQEPERENPPKEVRPDTEPLPKEEENTVSLVGVEMSQTTAAILAGGVLLAGGVAGGIIIAQNSGGSSGHHHHNGGEPPSP